jgi:hypothetical protein
VAETPPAEVAPPRAKGKLKGHGPRKKVHGGVASPEL